MAPDSTLLIEPFALGMSACRQPAGRPRPESVYPQPPRRCAPLLPADPSCTPSRYRHPLLFILLPLGQQERDPQPSSAAGEMQTRMYRHGSIVGEPLRFHTAARSRSKIREIRETLSRRNSVPEVVLRHPTSKLRRSATSRKTACPVCELMTSRVILQTLSNVLACLDYGYPGNLLHTTN